MKTTTFILQRISQQIELSKTAKETVTREYASLGNLISESDKIPYEVNIKPQGSYNLGTAIKPLNGSADDFDIDLVAVIEGGSVPSVTKNSIGDILKDSKLYGSKLLPEKNRAWTIKYEGSHVDVVPAIEGSNCDVLITNRLYGSLYEYRQSSPFEFKEWFIGRGQGIYQAQQLEKGIRATVETPQEYHDYTILQQVVQLLKHHRNQMFESRDDKIKPISMIITILAAEAYSGESDLSDALVAVTNGMRGKIETDSMGNLHIFNPTNRAEDFADKWISHPERKAAFLEWLQAVETDLGTTNRTEMIPWSKTLSEIYGSARVQNAFEDLGEEQSAKQIQGKVPLGTEGVFGEGDTDKNVRPHTFWGE